LLEFVRFLILDGRLLLIGLQLVRCQGE
jgi:hypothetical protein